ncbi:MAG: glycosyltransferase family 4 protein, partial [Phycisphaerae bacterium]|nr:glycosyltransferase family 4 protein [Phycisphaerae bacterium]
SIASVRSGGGRRDEFARAATVVHDGLTSNRFDLRAAVRIAQIIRREQIESVIIVDTLRNGMLFTALGSLLSGRNVRIICWCHSVPGGQAGRFVRRLRWYRSAGLLNDVVCVSQYLREELISQCLSQRDVCVIHNGINLSRFTCHGRPAREKRKHGRDGHATCLPLPANKHIIVQVANVVPDKDFQTLIEAAAGLAKRRDDFQLVLIGEGTDGPEIARVIEQAGAGEFITPVGKREDVPEILASTDMLVLSTKTESFGIAVLEAMASGLPVVASDVPALREVFTHESEGLKVRPGDADALAGAIERLLDDETLRQQLGDTGRKRAEEFTTERMADKFYQMLNNSSRLGRSEA